jgi:CBS domain containing-hemolysin-like protein
MIDRVLHPTETTVGEAMAPWSRTRTLRVNAPPEAAWALADRAPHTRFPLIDADGKVVGVLNIFDVLLYPVELCPPLHELGRELPRCRRDTSLRDALAMLRRQRSAMALVVDDRDKPLGVVTTKDLVEPITGDLAVW